MNSINNQESRRADRAEQCQTGDCPEDEFEVEVVADVFVAVDFRDAHGEDGVAGHPDDDDVRADRAVVVFLELGFGDGGDGDFDSIAEVAEGFVVAGVNIELLGRHVEFHSPVLAGFGGAEIFVDDVVSFGSPCHIVGVAKSVDLEGADVGREEGEVLA